MEKWMDLSGSWVLTSSEMPELKVTAELPGDQYSALVAAGICPDPYWAKNEELVQSYGNVPWCFERDFTVPDALLALPKVLLSMEMVDTFCEVRINGKKVLATDNMFRNWVKDVKPFLQSGKNHIALAFAAVTREAAKLAKKQPRPVPMNPCCKAENLNLVRKPHCHGGWDWGIELLVTGVYAPIRLIGCEDYRIETVTNRQDFQINGSVVVTLTAGVECFRKSAAGTFEFVFNGETKQISTVLNKGKNEISAVFTVKNPKLWWPNGYGEHPLYDVLVRSGITEKKIRIGLRKIELVNKRDCWGKSMAFKVNGADVFMKGADWIPCDAMPSRQTTEHFRRLLNAVGEAHMNMLRIWGGGQFEKDVFYDLCDEMGILLWHDMMFSCSLYPATEEFLESVRQELLFQIPRLQHHASIAMWCGDNELVGAVGWYCNGDMNLRATNLVMYDRLNRMLGKTIQTCDPTRTFWPSSPCGGPGNFNDGWHNDSEGDMHYWEVWHASKPFSAFYDVRPRFCSEFGYQSYPSFSTVRSFCPPEQFNMFSPVMDVHQKCNLGNSPILAMFERYFRMPANFRDFLYLSQVQQALAIKTAVEFWRTLKPRCMGTIYWQLNDLWPVVSWASLEYQGKWKLLHYQMKRSYAPLLITMYQEKNGDWAINAVSDVLAELKVSGSAVIRALDGKELACYPLKALLAPGASKKLLTFTPAELERFDLTGVFVTLELKARKFSAENTFFFVPYKQCNLPQGAMEAQVEKQGDAFAVTLCSDFPAFFAALDADDVAGTFEENMFTLLPGKARTVKFVPENGAVTLEEFRKKLTVTDLSCTMK